MYIYIYIAHIYIYIYIHISYHIICIYDYICVYTCICYTTIHIVCVSAQNKMGGWFGPIPKRTQTAEQKNPWMSLDFSLKTH